MFRPSRSSIAGWEPVPYARATEGVIVERFGGFADGELHLTLRNYAAEPVTTTVTLDRAALGLPADTELVAVDLLPGQAVTEPVGEGWQVEVGADDARAFWIGTRSRLSDRGFRLAGRTLAKIGRGFALTPEAEAALTAALDLAQRGAAAAGAEACALAVELAEATEALREAIETQALVDLAKLVLRVHGNWPAWPRGSWAWRCGRRAWSRRRRRCRTCRPRSRASRAPTCAILAVP